MRRSPALRPFVSVLTIVGLALLSTPAAAQDEPEQPTLDTIESSIESERDRAAELERQSETIAAEAATLRRQQIETAAAMQDHEERLSAFEDSLRTLEEAVATIERRLHADRGQAIATLAALQRLALTPPESALFAEGDPIDRARAAALLEQIYPRLAAHAERMRGDLADLAALRDSITAQRAAAEETAAALTAENETLATLAARQEELLAETDAERAASEERIAQLADEAEDLRDLIARLAETEPPAAKPETAGEAEADGEQVAALPDAPLPDLEPDIRAFPAVPGELVMPVRGDIVIGYGGVTGTGEASRGIYLETRPGAQVVVPYDGQVVYAGEFRGYGLILIVEHSDGYHSLLAGLGRVDARVGQWVLAGEPAGAMATGTDKDPELYVELRRAGQPIDPAPWLGIVAGG
jgi:septal ring factor EnvC (AmiA/AmiB activator)